VLLDSTFCLLSGFTATWWKVETPCHVRFAQRIALPLEVRLFRAMVKVQCVVFVLQPQASTCAALVHDPFDRAQGIPRTSSTLNKREGSRPEFVIYAFARDVVTGGPEGRSVVKVLLHHTNCGISGCYHNAPGLLSKHMGVAESELEKLEIDDPYKAVAVDVATLRANPNLPANLAVSGLVYDVQTGLVETVVPAAALRSE